MLNDPSKTTQGQQARTSLFLPAPPPQNTNGTIASAPLPRMARGGQKVQLPLALAMLSLVATTALVLGILFAVIPLLAQPKHSSNTTSIPKQIPTIPASTPPAADATQFPLIEGTATINGLSILPTHFTVQSDCQPDNGYRCTVTLYAAQDIQDDTQWQAFSDSLNTMFSPPNGTIEPGQQQQVIVYLYDSCPYNGTLVFSIEDNNLTVPVSC